MSDSKRVVREAACVLRALHATCPFPSSLPATNVLRYLAVHLRLDLPDVVATKDARRVAAIGLKADYAAALFKACGPDHAQTGGRMHAGTQALLDGLPPKYLKAALDAWDTEAPARLRQDPYACMFDLKASLDEADMCAGTPAPTDRMIQHARWLLRSAKRDGHSMVSRRELEELMAQRAGVPVAVAAQAVDLGIQRNTLAPVDADHVADPDLCATEMAIAREIRRRAAERQDDTLGELPDLTEEQQAAARLALGSSFAVLTGPPGTGKTTVVRALVDALGADAVLLTAPTGRAARHVGGSTVHSASGGQLLRRPLQETTRADVSDDVQLMVVDEASMLSTELMMGVLNLAPRNCRILLVGDADQLPPVGVGNVLCDVIECGTVPVARLTYNHRSVTEVQRVARDVLAGRVPDDVDLIHATSGADGLPAVVKTVTADDAVLVPHNVTRHAVNLALQSCAREVPVKLTNLTRIVPGTTGVLRTDPGTATSTLVFGGSERSTMTVSEALAMCQPRQVALPGDAVMVLKNQNKKRPRPGEVSACNGDIGYLVHAKPKAVVRFEDGISEFPNAESWLTLAYAATTFKYQGSECDRVVLPLYAGGWDVSTLYTAITRAKQRVTFVGSRQHLEAAVTRVRPRRRSALAVFLKATQC